MTISTDISRIALTSARSSGATATGSQTANSRWMEWITTWPKITARIPSTGCERVRQKPLARRAGHKQRRLGPGFDGHEPRRGGRLTGESENQDYLDGPKTEPTANRLWDPY